MAASSNNNWDFEKMTDREKVLYVAGLDYCKAYHQQTMLLYASVFANLAFLFTTWW